MSPSHSAPPSQDLPRRQSATPHYQTFPTKPPSGKGRPLTEDSPSSGTPKSSGSRDEDSRSRSRHSGHVSPLPVRQLLVLAFIALAEQTALNSFPPYLPDMVSTFPEVGEGSVGTYVGLVASAFALAQFATNFFWGWLSDRIGRKPVILIGTLLTAACVLAFGFCKTLVQAILAQFLMGLVNGNQGIVSTCLGEITDRSNQSRAFMYLPIVYGLGGITGPIVGGLLVNKEADSQEHGVYPYLPPNALSAALLFVELLVTMVFLEESLEELKDTVPIGSRLRHFFTYLWEFTGFGRGPSQRPSFLGDDSDADSQQGAEEMQFPSTADNGHLTYKDVFNRDVILILITFLIFQLANIAYNSLYPIFGQASQPTGRALSPEEIGVSLAFAGAVTILFQVGIFGRLRDRIGNKTTYRVGLAGFVLAFLLTPWVGYKSNAGGVQSTSRAILWLQLGGVLVIKTVASVGGLTSALLLITNSARDHTVLGTLNGLAQTLSAGGRAVGPFLSGSLFSLARVVQPKGEAIAFGVFGGVSLIGLFLSFFIRGGKLEDESWDDNESATADEEETEDADETGPPSSSEQTPLINGRK